MKIQQAKTETKDSTVALSDLRAGSTFRFAHDTLEEAFKSDLFWMRIEAPEAKDRVRLVNLADGKVVERDGTHRVVMHECVISLK